MRSGGIETMRLDGSPRILVIGYGNDLRSDDAAGPIIADLIAERDEPGVTALRVHQLTPELASPIAEADFVVFVDAAFGVDGEEVRCERLEPSATSHAIGHAATPARLLGLAESVLGRRPSAVLVTLPGDCFDVGEALSKRMRLALPKALTLIDRLTRERLYA